MEFPFGRHGHRRDNDADEEEEERRRYQAPQPPPPSSYYGAEDDYGRPVYPPAPTYGAEGGGREDEYGRPPYRPVQSGPHYGGEGGGREDEYGRPPQRPVQLESHYGGEGGDREDEYGRPPQRPVQYESHYGGGQEDDYGRPSYPPVQNFSHQIGGGGPRYGEEEEGRLGGYGGGGHRQQHHGGSPAYGGSGVVQHVGHETGGSDGRPRQPTVRIFTKAEESYSLSIRNGNVVLARSDPDDEYQHWIKDMRYSTKVKDEESFPSFALINKATGEALKHSIGATHPVRVATYKPDYLDESVLWTESRDLGDGFRCIRMVNNIRLNFDAFHGDKDHGGVRDGTTLVLWEWLKGDNQRWKIVPYCKHLEILVLVASYST